jgi:uncharacterized damage-inducible protein DinB
LPDDILDWQADPHSFSLRGLLRHVGNAEEWYVSRLVHPETPWPERRSQGGLPTAWKNDEGLPIFDFLEMERRTALARLRQLTEKERSEVFFPTHWTDHSDEPWTARKVLRRFLEHEQEHTAQAREILAAWRHHLLAHLASERAGLLRQIIGLDEGTLTGTSVFDDWTAKDLLAHIAAWDEIHAERLELVLTGREEEITVGEVGARNAALYAERRDWPLEQVLAACVNARAACLAVAARLSDQDLHRTRRFPWGEGSAATLAQRRARHDAIHAADLAAWRQAQKIQSRPGPKAILLAALAAGREELLAAADLMPPEARGSRAIVGEWTLKDVLGHVADWDWWGVKALRQVVTGRASQIKYVEDLEAWNQAHVAARRGQSWETVWADVHTARRALLDVLASMSQADLEQPFPSRWNGESTPYRWAEIYLEHDHEHARSLRIA